MDRTLKTESIEGEIALVIDYVAGESEALSVLAGAMKLIESLDKLDHCLLSSIDTTLEPVSILNDVQHSSLKILLARALRKIPDDAIGNLEWKKWVGSLLVKGKYSLLQNLESDTPQLSHAVDDLKTYYQSSPGLIGYQPPKIADVQEALDGVSKARSALGHSPVTIQTELGDVTINRIYIDAPTIITEVSESRTNTGREYLKVKSPDMLGQAQWIVMRSGRRVSVDILHRTWLESYQSGKVAILPGDSLDCSFEETIDYDFEHNEIGRKLSVIEVHAVIRPPQQTTLPL